VEMEGRKDDSSCFLFFINDSDHYNLGLYGPSLKVKNDGF